MTRRLSFTGIVTPEASHSNVFTHQQMGCRFEARYCGESLDRTIGKSIKQDRMTYKSHAL
jgi:hypothetical protein